LNVEEALGIAARIDAERLVLERATLRRQRIVGELEVEFAIAGADGRAKFAGGQVEETALGVGFDNGLTRISAVLQVCPNSLQAVLREAAGRWLEQVQAAGAGQIGRASCRERG